MNIQWFDILGIVGSALIILTYFWLQTGRISATQLSYSVLNFLGAGLILVSLFYDFNLSAFVIELFWLLISVLGVYKNQMVTHTK